MTATSEAHASSFVTNTKVVNGKKVSNTEKKSSNIAVDNKDGKTKCQSNTNDTVMKNGKVVSVKNGKGGCKESHKIRLESSRRSI